MMSITTPGNSKSTRAHAHPQGWRMSSWDGSPPPPREYVGPKRFGYPRIRRDRTEELEQRIAELERRLEVIGRQGLEIGGVVLAREGVLAAAQFGDHARELPRAVRLGALEHHVFQQVRQTGESVSLAPMTPFERKAVHDAVAGAGLVCLRGLLRRGRDWFYPALGLAVTVLAAIHPLPRPQNTPAMWLSVLASYK